MWVARLVAVLSALGESEVFGFSPIQVPLVNGAAGQTLMVLGGGLAKRPLTVPEVRQGRGVGIYNHAPFGVQWNLWHLWLANTVFNSSNRFLREEVVGWMRMFGVGLTTLRNWPRQDDRLFQPTLRSGGWPLSLWASQANVLSLKFGLARFAPVISRECPFRQP